MGWFRTASLTKGNTVIAHTVNPLKWNLIVHLHCRRQLCLSSPRIEDDARGSITYPCSL